MIKLNVGQIHRALEEFAFLHYDENLIDDLQLVVDESQRGGGRGQQSNRNSMVGGLHRPLLSMPPIVLMGAPGTDAVITPSPIVEMPPSPSPNHIMIVEFPCETLEGVLNIEDLMDDDRAIIDGEYDDDDTDVPDVDLDDDSYFAEGAIEVRGENGLLKLMRDGVDFKLILVVC